jgi:hypothetical protein
VPVPVPAAFVHDNVNEALAVSAAEISVPDAALVPDQLPKAVHEDGLLVADQVKVTVPPEVTLLGLAVRVTVGTCGGGGFGLPPPPPPPPPQAASDEPRHTSRHARNDML